MKKKFFISTLLIILILFAQVKETSYAETFCVKTSNELQDALTKASNNSEGDTIKVEQGS